jgi:hypothetical protein
VIVGSPASQNHPRSMLQTIVSVLASSSPHDDSFSSLVWVVLAGHQVEASQSKELSALSEVVGQ